MTRTRTYKTRGVVLKHATLGEADRIITLYTPDLGKLRAVARGMRRPKNKLSGHLELLTLVRVSLSRGRSLDHIGEAEIIRSFRPLREDLELIAHAVYLAELVDGFSVEGQASPPVFDLLLSSLEQLEATRDHRRVVRYFEVRLLQLSGFGPELHDCVGCSSPLEPGGHVFTSAMGGALCPACRTTSGGAILKLSLNAMKVLRYCQRQPLSAFVELRTPDAILNEIERVLRTYIRYILEREIKSAEFVTLVAGRA